MKKSRFFFLFISTLLLAMFSACSDDDDTIKVYYNFEGQVIVEGYTRITNLDTEVGAFQLRVKGGSGEYQASSSDPSVLHYVSEIKEEYSDKTGLNFSAYKVGSATVTITDSKNNSVKIPITVGARSCPVTVRDASIIVTGADEETRMLLEKDIEESQTIVKGSTLNMLFQTANDGLVTVYKDKDVKFDGTFEIEYPSSLYSTFKLNYNNRDYIYKVSSWDSMTKDLGPTPLVWVEYLTAEYREKYPDMIFEKIEYKLYVYAHWF